MQAKGKELQLAIKIAGVVDKSFDASIVYADTALKRKLAAVDRDFVKLDKGFDKIMSTGGKAFSAIATSAGVAAVAVGAAAASCTKAASDYEHQMADVMKYVEGLADAAGQASEALALDKDGNVLNGKTYAQNYKDMKGALLELSKEIPMTAEELTKLAAAAGQSGYGIADLFQYDSGGDVSGFLKDTAMMGTAMDISAEQAGDWAAKWEKAFNMNHGEIMVLADQINYLGANSATTAAEIAQVVNDAASLGQIAGIDVSTTAALADAMLATGVGSDKVATSVKRTITNLSKGTSATKAMKDQWMELGFTAEGVAMAMQEDSIGTLNSVFTAIGELPDYKQVAALSTLFGQWAIEGDAKIVGNLQVFRDALDMVSDPSKYSGSMEREFKIKANTSESIDTRVQNAFQAMKIDIGDSFLPVKKEYGQKLIDFIDEITRKMTSFNEYLGGANGLSKWIRDAETQFPTLQRKFNKYAKPVLSGVVDTGKWVVKNGNSVISVLTGIGAAMASYKAASTISHGVQSLLSLGNLQPVTLGIMGAVTAVGLLSTGLMALKQHEQNLVNQNLADHFGNIALSMEEIQKAAEYIVSSKSLEEAEKALSAFGALDNLSAEMREKVEELDKLNWKISIGMELTEEEQGSYKQAVEDYARTAQEYALQTQYAVSINLGTTFSEGDLEGQNVVNKVNQFYQDKYDELAALGTQLNEALTNAFNDGLLDIEETQVIADIQRQMAEVEQSLATGEFQAQLSLLGMKYSGEDLTADSFLNLYEEISNQGAAASETYEDAYAKKFNSYYASYKEGAITEEEYQKKLEDIQNEYLANVSELKQQGADYLLNTVTGTYGSEIEAGRENILSSIHSSLNEYMNQDEWWNKNTEPEDWANDIRMTYANALGDIGLDSVTKKALGELYESASSVQGELERQAAEFTKAGEEIPEELQKTLSEINMLGALSGDEDAIYTLIGQELGENEEYATVIELARAQGAFLPETFTDAMLAASPQATEKAQVILDDIKNQFEEGIDVTIPVTYDVVAQNDNFLNKTLGYSFQQETLKKIPGHADGGIVTAPQLSWLAEGGSAEAVIPLDGSRNAMDLWEKSGRLLGMQGAFDDLDLSGAGSTITIEYNPTYQFYGEAPSKEDLTEAASISQEEFDSHMEQFLKTHSRVSY